jgi:hypothetical protein
MSWILIPILTQKSKFIYLDVIWGLPLHPYLLWGAEHCVKIIIHDACDSSEHYRIWLLQWGAALPHKSAPLPHSYASVRSTRKFHSKTYMKDNISSINMKYAAAHKHIHVHIRYK